MPGASATQPLPARTSTAPRVFPTTSSRNTVRDIPEGALEPPLILASRLLSATAASATLPVAVIGPAPVVIPAPAATEVTPEPPTDQPGRPRRRTS